MYYSCGTADRLGKGEEKDKGVVLASGHSQEDEGQWQGEQLRIGTFSSQPVGHMLSAVCAMWLISVDHH